MRRGLWRAWLVVPMACGGALPTTGDDAAAPDATSDVKAGDASLDASADVISDAPVDSKPDAAPVLTVLATNQTQASWIAIDSTDVYWLTYNPTTAMKCAISGCNNTPTALATGETFGVFIGLDTTTAYWTNGGQAAGSISSCAKTGCSQNPTTLKSSLQAPWTVVPFGNELYFTTSGGGTVERMDLDGGNDTLFAYQQSGPAELVVDSTALYWANSSGNTIMKCAIGGCGLTPEVLADNQSAPVVLAIDSVNVYWVNSSTSTVMSCGLGGCNNSPTTLASNQTGAIWGITTDGANVYWTTSSGVMKCATTGCGGNPTPIATNQNHPYAVAVDSNSVYWTTSGDGTVVKLTPK